MMFLELMCPYCNSKEHTLFKNYKTLNNGTRSLYQCDACRKIFSETSGTFLEGLTKPVSLIITVLKARSEGIGLNAACRVFKIAKNTLLTWERRFADAKETLIVYALMTTFLSSTLLD